MSDALRRAADECPIMCRAVALAGWVGEGRPVTAKGVLKPVDIEAAMAAMGLAAPVRSRTAADVEALHRPWVAAQAIGLIKVDAGRAVAAGRTSSDALEAWWAALSAVLRAESHDHRGEGATVLCRMLLAVLADDPAIEKIEDLVEGRLLADEVSPVYQAFRRGVMPVDAGLELLAAFGAVDAAMRLTPLGRWAGQRFPAAVTAELSADELLARLAGVDEQELLRAAQRWYTGRDVHKAAAEVLAAAERATPAARCAGIDLVGALGMAMRPVWRSALRRPMLAPHARAALSTWDPNPRPPSEADHRWLAVEYALAAEDLEEAWHLVDEFGGLEVVAGSTHPDAGALLDALKASGPPPRQVYQLKIALSRVSPPVWRRVRVPGTVMLDVLHHIIQVAFDWDDDHLHLFESEGRRYADPDFELDDCADESDIRLAKALAVGGSMTYTYDLGDCWEHRITVERVDEVDAVSAADIVCVDGRGDAPVEDWHEEAGPATTPFDADAINRRLAETLR
ncbi:plasmid pRiA4b ORF-3 family protein [Dactylosporangium sp. NPDC050688]|uniref:plasmid pRiA4b ORF-3 family protein n=1 Tax=Dactylosporangium sp. NPDC050688 TaxID=3157217 RepID=UPI0033F18BD0